ncbi:unnamed protein product [Lactuca virosa]|uniref:Uncharacterized protein n=1 Tax=Lactuca virosa TaxID=75947 RepID=A0AAU9N085_9ASTR|nr:unnamed protein product [Lactuca virosa]
MKQRSESMDTATTNHRQMQEDDVEYTTVAIHSQVLKIKQELEKTMQPELRSVLREFSRQPKRSRSPLGITNRRISVGNA